MDGAGAAVVGPPKGFGAELTKGGAPNPDAGGCTKGAGEPPKPVAECAETKLVVPLDTPKGVNVADAPNAGVVVADTPNAGVDAVEGAPQNPVVVLELPNAGVMAGTFPKPEVEEVPKEDGPPAKGDAVLVLAPNPPPNATGVNPNPLAGAAPKPGAPNPEAGGAAPNPPNWVGDGFGAGGEPNGVLGGADPKPPPKPDMLKQKSPQAINPCSV
jgi:hypothetical protein